MATFETRLSADDQEVEYYINGVFEASWSMDAGIPQPLTLGMKQLLERAYEEGKTARSKEIRKILGLNQ